MKPSSGLGDSAILGKNRRPSNPIREISGSNIAQKSRLQRYHYWILLMRHASECRRPPGKCKLPRCHEAKEVCDHIKTCRQGRSCQFNHCVISKKLIAHYMQCSRSRSRRQNCPICGPVKAAIRQEKVKNTLEKITLELKSMNMGIDINDELFGSDQPHERSTNVL